MPDGHYPGMLQVAAVDGQFGTHRLVVHLAFLTGFKNRLAAVANWAVAFLGHQRRQRTITEQQVFARTRVEQPEAAAAKD